MSYKLYVPLMNQTQTEKNRKIYLDYLKKIKADVVFLCPTRESFYMEDEKQIAYFKGFSENARFYKEQGFRLGVWISTFGFGGPLNDEISKKMQEEFRITSVLGAQCGDAFCPEGQTFVSYCVRYIQQIAKFVEPEMIMLDDELCLSVRPGLGCFCEQHMKLYGQEFGELHSREDLKKLIFTGYNEKYRKGWLNVVGNSMRKFCRTLRENLDKVRAETRMGFCAGFTSWDIEGADAIELTKILAGKTKPFLRFSGAPYWVSRKIQRFRGQSLAEIIEYVRLQEKWCEDKGIEIFHECDTFPRPRYNVPAAHSECFDIALRASGNMGGMKYLFNYDMDPEYELGYIKKHIRNTSLYALVEKYFNNKDSVGIQVFEEMHKMKDMVLPETFENEALIMEKAFSPAAHFLSAQGIPMTYSENQECGIVFGENARYIKTLPKKLVLDMRAVEILQERGFDVGLLNKSPAYAPSLESYGEGKTIGYGYVASRCYECDISKNAKVETYFTDFRGKTYPSSYRYESGEVQFLVFAFDAYDTERNEPMFTCYFRQKQLLDFFGVHYPYIKGLPEIYVLCKDGYEKGKLTRAVLFLNIHEDEETDFCINLDKEYESVECFGFEGEVKGKEVVVRSVVQPYSWFILVLR